MSVGYLISGINMTICCRESCPGTTSNSKLTMARFSWCFVALIINQAVSSTYSYIEKDESTGSRESAATDFKGGNRTSPPAHGGKRSGSRPPRPTPLESTIVATIDNASVYEVDEFTSALLATDEAWESEKKGNVSGIQLKNGS